MSKRKDFEDKMTLETLTKEAHMNTREIRTNHYINMQNLELEYYNKSYMNDNVLDYDFLHDKANYRPLGQQRRPFFLMPRYARRQDWEWNIGLSRRLKRMLLGVACLGIGYKVGSWDSKDELLAASTVVEFETEEQIYDLLFNKKKLAVFLTFYSPSKKTYDDWNNVFERESSKY